MDAAAVRGMTVLRMAAEGGHTELVQVLLDAGAAINAADAVGDTPLHLAALEGNASLVQCC